MTWEWWAAFIGGPSAGPFIVRRAWWWLCVGAGWVDDLRGERELADDKTAFANGRAYVFQTARHLARLQFERIDWRGLALGFLLSCKHFHAVCAMTWAGVKRDARVFLEWVWAEIYTKPRDRKRVLALYAEGQDAIARRASLTQAGSAPPTPWPTAPVNNDHAESRFQYDRIMATPKPTDKDLYMLPQVLQGLINNGDHPQGAWAQAQPVAIPRLNFLGAATALNPARLYVMGAALVFAVGGWTWGFERNNRVTHVVNERNTIRASLASFKTGVKDRDTRIGELRKEVTTQNVQCVTETVQAATRRETQTNRRITAETIARGKVNEASSGAARPFNLDERLRELSGPAGSPTASTDGSTPS